jgi:hypothetical protein
MTTTDRVLSSDVLRRGDAIQKLLQSGDSLPAPKWFSREHALRRFRWADEAETAYKLANAYRGKNKVELLDKQPFFCPTKLKTGKLCRNEADFLFGRSPDPGHRLPDQDHTRWFKDRAGNFIFTSQPYVTDSDEQRQADERKTMEAQHQAIAERLGLAFRMSEDESWWYPGRTVLLEYKSK